VRPPSLARAEATTRREPHAMQTRCDMIIGLARASLPIEASAIHAISFFQNMDFVRMTLENPRSEREEEKRLTSC
jgi:hypothetical protein